MVTIVLLAALLMYTSVKLLQCMVIVMCSKEERIVWYGVVWHGVVQCGMVWYGVAWCGAVWHGVV